MLKSWSLFVCLLFFFLKENREERSLTALLPFLQEEEKEEDRCSTLSGINYVFDCVCVCSLGYGVQLAGTVNGKHNNKKLQQTANSGPDCLSVSQSDFSWQTHTHTFSVNSCQAIWKRKPQGFYLSFLIQSILVFFELVSFVSYSLCDQFASSQFLLLQLFKFWQQKGKKSSV